MNQESYQQLLDALTKVFDSLQGTPDSSEKDSLKGASDKAITIVSIGKAKASPEGMIPKAKKNKEQAKV